ncbi:MAG: hypothetical protein J6X58_06760 [Bacteroidales bacterium]|nr:hypothetical protein [Bacteroidales bacterium]
MKKTTLIIMLLSFFGMVSAQGLRLTFTSMSDAKFFVYINGKLQNERASGMVTINDLEDKDYHVRIVIDDPFEIAVTQTIRPAPKRSDYTVQFNAVRERVYLKLAKVQRDEPLWQPEETEQSTTVDNNSEEKPKSRSRTTIKRTSFEDTATQQVINKIRTKTLQ